MIVSWLRNSTTPQIKSSLMYLESASQIWSDLHDRFSQGNKARIYELKQQLFGLHQGASDINTYYTNLRIIWDELIDTQPKEWCSCNGCRCDSAQDWHDFQMSDFTMHFLMGLNDSYSYLRSQFLSLDHFPSFSKIFSLVLQEERQRDINHGLLPTPPTSPMSESPVILSNATQNFGNRSIDKLFCTHCHKTNHTVDKCFVLHGFPPGFSRGRGRGAHSDAHSSIGRSVHNMNQSAPDGMPAISPILYHPSAATPPSLSLEQCQQLITFLQGQMQTQALQSDSAPSHSSTGSCDFPNFSDMFSLNPFSAFFQSSHSTWLIDTGVSHHVCCSSSFFTSLIPLQNAFLTLPNSQKVPIHSTGSITLTPTLTFHSVFFVSELSYNLLSISALTSSTSCSVSFSHTGCIIQDVSTEMKIGMGKRYGNLYVLEIASPCNSDSSVNLVISSDIWHSRLGHLGFEKLKLLSSTLSLKSLSHNVCDICPLAKQKHQPYHASLSHVDNIFDLIHCDVWGPFNPVSVTGHKYFLTIVDDHSRFVWTYLLSSKSDVGSVLHQFMSQIQTQFQTSVKILRCDNGTEFHHPLLFNKFGISIQHSCVKSPQQNARVEKKHQHLLNVARSLFFQSAIPLGYWSDCILTVSYIINRIPSTVLPSSLTPFEILFHRKPSYTHLQIFGCLCFASTLHRDMSKFSPRAIKCVFSRLSPWLQRL